MTSEKTTNNEKRSEARKERFEFKLTMNGYIVCQRYFRINGFKREVYGSFEIVQALDNCVEMIKKDMRDKTQMFLEYTAPQVCKDVDEMNEWLQKPYYSEDRPDYVLIASTGEVYQIKPDEVILYEKAFNRGDYLSNSDEQTDAVLKFSFCDGGREVAAVTWDAMVYPRFIRTNIDLSNSRNRYKQDGIFAPLESVMIERFNESFEDLIPKIVKELYDTCTYEDVDMYTDTLDYGERTYDLDIDAANRKWMRKVENDWYKKKKKK